MSRYWLMDIPFSSKDMIDVLRILNYSPKWILLVKDICISWIFNRVMNNIAWLCQIHCALPSPPHPSTLLSHFKSSVGWKKPCISKMFNVQESHKTWLPKHYNSEWDSLLLWCHSGSNFSDWNENWTGQNLVS